MVCNGDVVVNGLRYAYHENPLFPAGLLQFSAGIHRTISAVHQDVSNVVLFQHLGHFLIMLRLQCKARGSDRRRRRRQQLPCLRLRICQKIHEAFFQNRLRSTDRRQHLSNLSAAAGLLDDTIEGGVYNRCRRSAMYNQ